MGFRKMIFLGFWILSLIAISFYGGTISYGIFFGLTLLPACCMVYLLFVYYSFRLYQKVESRNMVCGQEIPYFFVLQNDSFFAFSGVSVTLFSTFSYVDELPDSSEYELLPKDRYTFKTHLVCKYRGEYEVGIKEIIITDFMRLFRIKYKAPETIRALVLPKIVRVSELTSVGDVSAIVQKENLVSGEELDAILREYVEGDSIKRIHWKATARTGNLKVRNLTGEEKQGITLFCDTKRYGNNMHSYLPIENKVLETFLALGIFFAEKNISFELCYGQSKLVRTTVSGMQEFEEFYHKTTDISFMKEEQTSIRFSEAAMTGVFSESKVVFCVLQTLDVSVFEVIDRLVATGVMVVIYLITNEAKAQYEKQNSMRKKIVVISPNDDLEGRL